MEKDSTSGEGKKNKKHKPFHITFRNRGKRHKATEFNSMQQLAGVCYYLHDKGLEDDEEKHNVIKMYAVHMRWELPEKGHIAEACILIQEDFVSFVQWFYLHIRKEELMLPRKGT